MKTDRRKQSRPLAGWSLVHEVEVNTETQARAGNSMPSFNSRQLWGRAWQAILGR
jgi:hypothetical protein